jgi:hypothetical protein
MVVYTVDKLDIAFEVKFLFMQIVQPLYTGMLGATRQNIE